jgi:hypothetical protein
MTATLDDVTKKSKREPTAEEKVAEELVRRAREQGLSLTGPDGLLKQLTKTVLEIALNQEITEHLGHDKHGPPGNETGNVRNGTRAKTVLTEGSGQVGIEVPRDRDGSFEPQIVKKRQRRLSGVDEIVLSLYAKGLTTGEISAHFAEIYGASVSKETISRITDKVVEEMADWCNRPLDGVYAAIFVDAVMVKVRDGQVANRPIYAAIGVSLAGEKDILGLWSGTGGEGAKFWMSVLTDLRNRGVADVFFVVCDGLKGLPEVVGNAWPQAIVQTCVIHRCRKDSTWCFVAGCCCEREEVGGCGEVACSVCRDVAVLLEQGQDVVDGVADGAAADSEQVAQGLLVAELPLSQHGGQDPVSIGDLLPEDAAPGPWQSVAAALAVPAPFDGGVVGNCDPLGQGLELVAGHAGQVGVGQGLRDLHLAGDRAVVEPVAQVLGPGEVVRSLRGGDPLLIHEGPGFPDRLADGDGVGAKQAGQDLLRADLTQVDDGDEGAVGVCQQGFAMSPGRFQAPSGPAGLSRWVSAVWRRPAPRVRTAWARARRDPARMRSCLARVTPV